MTLNAVWVTGGFAAVIKAAGSGTRKRRGMRTDKHNAFTFIEVMLSMAIVVILAGAMLTGGKYLKTRAERQLTQSTIGIIGVALEQYYEQYKAFPFYNRDVSPADGKPDEYTVVHLQQDITNSVVLSLNMQEKDGKGALVSNASGAALFYFLERCKESREIATSITTRLVTNKDAVTSLDTQIQINSIIHDLPRFIDAWGMSLRYECLSGDSFPVIISAGPDKTFGTEDDLSSK